VEEKFKYLLVFPLLMGFFNGFFSLLFGVGIIIALLLYE